MQLGNECANEVTTRIRRNVTFLPMRRRFENSQLDENSKACRRPVRINSSSYNTVGTHPTNVPPYVRHRRNTQQILQRRNKFCEVIFELIAKAILTIHVLDFTPLALNFGRYRPRSWIRDD